MINFFRNPANTEQVTGARVRWPDGSTHWVPASVITAIRNAELPPGELSDFSLDKPEKPAV